MSAATPGQAPTSDAAVRAAAEVDAADRIIRDILESLCRRDGLSLESSVVPGEPARNYELCDRLGIGHVFGLKPQAAAPARPAPELAAAETAADPWHDAPVALQAVAAEAMEKLVRVRAENRGLRGLLDEVLAAFGPTGGARVVRQQQRVAAWRKQRDAVAVAVPEPQPAPELAAYEADIASLTDQRNRVSETADQLRTQVRNLRDELERLRDAAGQSPAAVHLMTIEMGAWCGATGPRFNGRASSAWREVTCTECLAKGAAWLRALAWDMLQTMPASREALAFAVRAGRLGVTDEQGRPLAMACARYGTVLPGDESKRDAVDAQTLHDSPGSDLDEAERDDVLRMRREMAYEAGDDFAGRPRDSMEDAKPASGATAAQAFYEEDEQRAADLRAHVSGTGGPSPAWVTDGAAGLDPAEDDEARYHARRAAEDDQ